MNEKNQINDDLHDQLIDGALRELVGTETPPDLSERILHAAAGEEFEQLSTLSSGDNDMSAQHRHALRKRNLWIGGILAASLLVAGALLLPTFQTGRERAQSTPEDKHVVASEAKNATNEDGNSSQDAENVDFEHLIDLIQETVDPNAWEVEQKGDDQATPFPNNLSLEVSQSQRLLERGMRDEKLVRPLEPATDAPPIAYPSQEVWEELAAKREKYDSLQMGVTPRIIIQDEEEERLGIETEAETQVALPSQSESGAKASSKGFGSGRAAGEYGEFGGRSNQHQQYFHKENLGRLALPVPQSVDGHTSDYVERKFRNTGKDAGGRLARGARSIAEVQRDVSRQIREKIKNYETLAAGIGGADSTLGHPALNAKIKEVRGIQQQIMEEKQKLVEAEVNKKISEQQHTSNSMIEQAVAEELDKDPKLESYKQEEFAIAQQIRGMQSQSKQGKSPQLKRLKESLAQLQQARAQQRAESEKSIREEIRRTPNDLLATVMSEYILRRDAAQQRIAKLEQKYKKTVGDIEGMSSGPFSELALLESEIEQLRDINQELDIQLRKEAMEAEQGHGPDASGDKYTRIHENPFVPAEGERAVSTFSIDVDTASYANVRQFLMQSGQLPPPDAVRIEELVNYFDYEYTPPTGDTPFASHVEVAGCPWRPEHRLVRVGIKGREIETDKRPQSNLVFLIDVSGSMNEPAKLPLLVEGMKMMTRQLGENDRVAIVVYASSEGLALPSTRGDQQDTILAALDQLRAGGSTAGGAGIELAYKVAKQNFIDGGVNRVILATDGDFNVGVTSPAALEEMAETKAKQTGVFLTVLGFGRGNLNDAMMEQISGKGNGNYHYVDNQTEARKVLVAEMAGTLVTIAKDVKIQIEFNSAQVAAYRLIGYENRMLETQDFNDDKKDAGEIGAGHTVTAIYEIVPAGKAVETPAVDPLKYQHAVKVSGAGKLAGELLTLKIRYKEPDGDVSTKLEFPITDNGQSFAEATDDFKFASAVASFGMLLRHSEHRGHTSYSAVEEIAQSAIGKDARGYRAEFVELVQHAKSLAGEQ